MVNTLRLRQNGRHFPDDVFKCIFLNENVWISIKISLKFVPLGPINNIPALVQIMVWHWPGAKPLSEPMMINLLTHICVIQPQWVKFIGLSQTAEQNTGIILGIGSANERQCYIVTSPLTGWAHTQNDDKNGIGSIGLSCSWVAETWLP